MLRITRKQLDLFSQAMWQSLRRDLAAQLRNDYPVKWQGRDDAVLFQYIDVMLEFASGKRLERTPSICRLVGLQMRHSFHPDLNPTLRHPLEQYALDEAVRLDNFEQVLTGKTTLTVVQLGTPLMPQGVKFG